MTKKTTVDLKVSGQDTMRVEAYVSPTPGLAVHRQVVWVPGKEEHKTTSKWTITHTATGHSLLRPSECLSTMAKAMRIADSLGHYDWDHEEVADQPGIREALLDAISQEGGDDTSETASVQQEPSQRFVIRRNHDGPGYNVIDLNTDDVIQNFMHRGLAKELADEKNAKESI